MWCEIQNSLIFQPNPFDEQSSLDKSFSNLFTRLRDSICEFLRKLKNQNKVGKLEVCQQQL
jgi:hypothetical protein